MTLRKNGDNGYSRESGWLISSSRLGLEVVEEFAVATIVNVDLGGSMLLIQLLVIVLLVHIKVNVVRAETPALIIDQQTAIVLLVRARHRPTVDLRYIDLFTLGKIVSSNGDIRTKGRTVSYNNKKKV